MPPIRQQSKAADDGARQRESAAYPEGDDRAARPRDVKAQCNQCGTHRLSQQPRSRDDAAGAAAALGWGASHQRLEIGCLEKAEPGATHTIRQPISIDDGDGGSVARDAMPMDNVKRPIVPRIPAGYRSARRPASGAMMATTAGHGVIRKPVAIWLFPRPTCRKNGNETNARPCVENEQTDVTADRENDGTGRLPASALGGLPGVSAVRNRRWPRRSTRR